MRKAFTTLLALLALAGLPLSAQENKKKKAIDLEQEFFQLPDSVTNEWLDATPLPKKARINDYWIVGVHGGVSLQYGYYNPPRQTRFYPNLPVWGVSITRFATMMNTFPNLGMEVGFQHNYEGYNFKEYEVDGIDGKDTYRQDIDGYHEAYMEVPEVFILTHGHIDMGQYAKINLKLGMYGGYRMNITRIHDNAYNRVYHDPEIAHSFRDTDNRWSYGVQGGLLEGEVIYSPVETAVVDQVAAVGHERGSVLHPEHGLASELPQQFRSEGAAESADLHRHRGLLAEFSHELDVIGDDDLAGRRSGYYLLPEQRTAQPLHEVEFRVHLVGAVERHIDPFDGGDVRHIQAEALCQLRRLH